MKNTNKLILGTVQFGCQYGINSAGKPSVEQVVSILHLAQEGGIQLLDTSSAYGNAETVLGSIEIAKKFKIVSKYPKCEKSVFEMFQHSCEQIGTNHLYGYILHHFELFQKNPMLWADFEKLRESGKTDHIGFSLYEPEELELILNIGVNFDLLQIPYNLFDRQFEPYFELLKRMGVEIHVRSTFLQGLFFMDRETLPEKLYPLKPYLMLLDRYAKENNLSIAEIALNYNIQNPDIDGVLIGVDNVAQLKQNFESLSNQLIKLDIKVKEQDLLKPVNWK